MITGISIENFKGIGERVDIDFAPITLLFGANSAGKSSILHALHYAREIFERRNLDADITVGGGRYVDLGGFRNSVHGRDKSQVVVMTLEVSLDDYRFSILGDKLLIPDDARVHFEEGDLPLDEHPKCARVQIDISWDEDRGQPYVARYSVHLDGEAIAAIEVGGPKHTPCLVDVNHFHPLYPDWPFVGLLEIIEGIRIPTVPTSVDEHGEQSVEGTTPSGNDGNPDTWSPPARSNEWKILTAHIYKEFSRLNGGWIELSQADALPHFADGLEIDEYEFFERARDYFHDDNEQKERWSEGEEFFNLFNLFLCSFMVGAGRAVRDALVDMRYLGPLRETPPRNFEPPRFLDPSRWSCGLGAWDTLYVGPEELVEDIDDWMGSPERLATGYGVFRGDYYEVPADHPLLVQLITGRAFDSIDQGTRLALDRLPSGRRLFITSTDNEGKYSPHDVGIGISQLVPVVVTALDKTGGLAAIEQPELHLHPRLQAELGDLFIHATREPYNHQFLIETHSEHLILRILRRIRETNEGDVIENRPEMTPDRVAVLFFRRVHGATEVHRLRIDETGEFIDGWPDGFFDERAKELF